MFSSLFSLMKYETSRHSTECFDKSSGGSPSAYRQLISNNEAHKSVHTRIITVSATSIEYSASFDYPAVSWVFILKKINDNPAKLEYPACNLEFIVIQY